MEPEPKDFLEHLGEPHLAGRTQIPHKILNLKRLGGPPRLNAVDLSISYSLGFILLPFINRFS